MRAAFIALALAAPIALTACDETGQQATPGAMPVASEGEQLFMQYCAACHGEDGRGGGPLAPRMARVPADLTRIAALHNGTFPRAEVMSTVDGYARSDLEGPAMPEFGELLAGDLVPYDSGDGIATPTPRKLVALVTYLESIQAASR